MHYILKIFKQLLSQNILIRILLITAIVCIIAITHKAVFGEFKVAQWNYEKTNNVSKDLRRLLDKYEY